MSAPARLASIVIDDADLPPAPPEVSQERNIAIFDLMEANVFAPEASTNGPFALTLAVRERKLILGVTDAAGVAHEIALPNAPFRKAARDYFAVCDSYFDAVRTKSPQEIEQLDAGRRVLHSEGAELVVDRLAGRVTLDDNTARRLFTLIATLQLRG